MNNSYTNLLHTGGVNHEVFQKICSQIFTNMQLHKARNELKRRERKTITFTFLADGTLHNTVAYFMLLVVLRENFPGTPIIISPFDDKTDYDGYIVVRLLSIESSDTACEAVCSDDVCVYDNTLSHVLALPSFSETWCQDITGVGSSSVFAHTLVIDHVINVRSSNVRVLATLAAATEPDFLVTGALATSSFSVDDCFKTSKFLSDAVGKDISVSSTVHTLTASDVFSLLRYMEPSSENLMPVLFSNTADVEFDKLHGPVQDYIVAYFNTFKHMPYVQILNDDDDVIKQERYSRLPSDLLGGLLHKPCTIHSVMENALFLKNLER